MSERRSHAWETRSTVGARVVAASLRVSHAQVELWQEIAALDTDGGWIIDGARSLAAWLAAHLGIGIGHASRLLAEARGAQVVPQVARALQSGELSEVKARVLLEACTDARAEYVARDIDLLVDRAATLRMHETRAMVTAWAARVDGELSTAAREAAGPEVVGALEAAKAMAFRMRRFDLGSPCLASVVFDGVTDSEGGSIIHAAIEARLRRNQPDPTEAIADGRSAAQKRHDALVDICRDSLQNADTPVVGGERPNVSVIIDLDVLLRRQGGVGLTDRGAQLSVEQVRQICCDAKINRVVMAGESTVLDLGRGTRTPSVHLRRAVVIRDQSCRFPGCSMPGRYCDAHHIVHWADDGTTDTANLMLLCGHHHRVIHDDEWSVHGDANGPLTFTRPDGSTHTEPALRGWRPPDLGRPDDRPPDTGPPDDEDESAA